MPYAGSISHIADRLIVIFYKTVLQLCHKGSSPTAVYCRYQNWHCIFVTLQQVDHSCQQLLRTCIHYSQKFISVVRVRNILDVGGLEYLFVIWKLYLESLAGKLGYPFELTQQSLKHIICGKVYYSLECTSLLPSLMLFIVPYLSRCSFIANINFLLARLPRLRCIVS